MMESKPIDTPMDLNVKLLPNQGEHFANQGKYWKFVGNLNYLTISWLDISLTVSVVS